MNILLGVNIDHVATLRQARGTRYPDPLQAAIEAEQAGADAITVHLREDRRHIQERDVAMLMAVVHTKINLEMAATDEMLAIAEKYQPANCCLVPEKREELTTEGGLDVARQLDKMALCCQKLSAAGVTVSLFIDPDVRQIEAAAASGAPVIELHTGRYADATSEKKATHELQTIISAVAHGRRLGLQVNAGHGLNYHNVSQIAGIADIVELNIGHAIIARALFTGMQSAVRAMKQLMVDARRG